MDQLSLQPAGAVARLCGPLLPVISSPGALPSPAFTQPPGRPSSSRLPAHLGSSWLPREAAPAGARAPLLKSRAPGWAGSPLPRRIMAISTVDTADLLSTPVLLAPSEPRRVGTLQPPRPSVCGRLTRLQSPHALAVLLGFRPVAARAVCLHSLRGLPRARPCAHQAGSPTLSEPPPRHAHTHTLAWLHAACMPSPPRVSSAVRPPHCVSLGGRLLCFPG